MMRRVVLGFLLALSFPWTVAAQLRPLDPFDWTSMEVEGASLVVGGSFLHGQRASVAGTEGRLMELGRFVGTWSFGRVAVTLGGVALWVYRDQSVFAPPVQGARDPDGHNRVDTGEYRVSTHVLLTPPGRQEALALRFGTRLPTTDNHVGLGRDATDFFTTVAGRLDRGVWRASAEVGLGIITTRDPNHEQVDPVLFAGSFTYGTGSVRPFVELTGQHDTRSGREPRGTENLGEGRVGLQVGQAPWIRGYLIRGWTRMGPELGMTVEAGFRF